jgi:transcriptional regulator with XRE-family HTH domain
MEFIGRRIRNAREASGLTQQQLAKELGVQQSVISNYEKGKTWPRPETINKLSHILDVPVNWLSNTASEMVTLQARLALSFLHIQNIEQLPFCCASLRQLLHDHDLQVIGISFTFLHDDSNDATTYESVGLHTGKIVVTDGKVLSSMRDYWDRGEIWSRPVEMFDNVEGKWGFAYAPLSLVDVPIKQGMVGCGFSTTEPHRATIDLLEGLCQTFAQGMEGLLRESHDLSVYARLDRLEKRIATLTRELEKSQEAERIAKGVHS